MAIEDGYAIGIAFAKHADNPEEAFLHYRSLRIGRVLRVARRTESR